MMDIQPRQQLGTLFTYRATFIIANTGKNQDTHCKTIT